MPSKAPCPCPSSSSKLLHPLFGGVVEVGFPFTTLEEVKKHNSLNNLWIVIDNYVYDVTKYVDEHPGGAEVLMEHAGTDATRAFEDVGHSKDAKQIMQKYKIGQLRKTKKSSSGSSDSSKLTTVVSLLLLVSAIIAAGAIAYKKFK